MRLSLGLEACLTVNNSEPGSALSLLIVGYSGGTQEWLGLRERVVRAVRYIMEASIDTFSSSKHSRRAAVGFTDQQELSKLANWISIYVIEWMVPEIKFTKRLSY